MQQDLHELSERLLRVQEDERKRLSRELHDQVGQALTAVSVSLATLRNNGHGHLKREKTFDGTQHLLRQAMDTVHHFARELRPAMLEELGLVPALRSYIREDAVSSAQRRQRLGLLGMQERVRLVNGRFSVKPKPGKGTTVQVEVPFKVSKPMALPKWSRK